MPEDESSSEIIYVCCAERERHNTQRHKRSFLVSPRVRVDGVRVTVKSRKGVDTKLNVQINCSRADLLHVGLVPPTAL
jgi:hypothetical protein